MFKNAQSITGRWFTVAWCNVYVINCRVIIWRVINWPSDYMSVINCRVIKCQVIKCHQTVKNDWLYQMGPSFTDGETSEKKHVWGKCPVPVILIDICVSKCLQMHYATLCWLHLGSYIRPLRQVVVPGISACEVSSNAWKRLQVLPVFWKLKLRRIHHWKVMGDCAHVSYK